MTTFCASGATAWATSRSIVVSPRGSAGWPPTRVGVNFGSLYSGREAVQVGLVVAVEREDHDGLALAGESGRGELAHVVGVQQRARLQPLVRHVQRQHRRPRRVMRDVAQDPAEFGHLGPQFARAPTAAAGTRRTADPAGRGSRAPQPRMRSRPFRLRPRRRPSCGRAAIAPKGLGPAPSRPTAPAESSRARRRSAGCHRGARARDRLRRRATAQTARRSWPARCAPA